MKTMRKGGARYSPLSPGRRLFSHSSVCPDKLVFAYLVIIDPPIPTCNTFLFTQKKKKINEFPSELMLVGFQITDCSVMF